MTGERGAGRGRWRSVMGNVRFNRRDATKRGRVRRAGSTSPARRRTRSGDEQGPHGEHHEVDEERTTSRGERRATRASAGGAFTY
jgi:hypothetical protein